MHMNEYWLTMGRKKVSAAADLWRVCSETGHWRDYGRHAVIPEYPAFKEKQWLEREEFEFAAPDQKLIMAG